MKRSSSLQNRPPHWRPESCLFPALTPDVYKILDDLPKTLEQVWPLSRSHRRQLPGDIHELSLLLTSQRAGLRQNYWRKPAFISAYLYYFLPWNLIRFCRLLPALRLLSPSVENEERPLLADAGAGPLAAALALWIAKPEWRNLPITVFALDAVRQPLELGVKLFAALAQKCASPCWNVRTCAGPLEGMARLAQESAKPCKPWLCIAANVLNEIRAPKFNKSGDAPDADRLEMLLAAWRPFWREGCQLLFMEPGTRLGGAIIMRLRAVACGLGLIPQAPCVHNSRCPLDESEKSGLPSSWCHFVFSAQDAPEWLRDLSRKAGLFKTSLTLSPLLLSSRPETPKASPGALPVRIISQAFPVGDQVARYGCSPAGLTLLPNSRNMVSGTLCFACKPAQEDKRDAHSGALLISPYTQ